MTTNLEMIRSEIKRFKTNPLLETCGKTWLDNCEFLLSKLEPYLTGKITEEMLRDHDGFLHIGGCELTVRGTTEKLKKLEERCKAIGTARDHFKKLAEEWAAANKLKD